jgi:two-component system alkaline phosphatase synthesis response regulator PhoP
MTTKANILIVDDDPDIRDVLRMILEKAGYSVLSACNADEARKILGSSLPNLMILDVMMTTDTEGFDFMFELKETEEYKNLPIIFLTSFLEKVRTSGPAGFEHIMGETWQAKWIFEKPIDPGKLLKQIEEILGER